MKNMLLYPVGTTEACHYAARYLDRAGIPLTDHPSPEVTHLLLDVPSFGPDGTLRGGGDLHSLLRMLPPDISVAGGNLQHPALEVKNRIDLLQDPYYLARNAAITAECALQVAYPRMAFTLDSAPCLVIGWGRIGKCLGKLLKSIGANVTVAARRETDRAMLEALGYEAVEIAALPARLPQYRLIFNTAPTLILNKEQLSLCKDCLKIDLASTPGLEGEDVITAKGLPGVYAPETSGKLIAHTLMQTLHLHDHF